jgi:hypothetical protein
LLLQKERCGKTVLHAENFNFQKLNFFGMENRRWMIFKNGKFLYGTA